jgi:hypothetical protein
MVSSVAVALIARGTSGGRTSTTVSYGSSERWLEAWHRWGGDDSHRPRCERRRRWWPPAAAAMTARGTIGGGDDHQDASGDDDGDRPQRHLTMTTISDLTHLRHPSPTTTSNLVASKASSNPGASRSFSGDDLPDLCLCFPWLCFMSTTYTIYAFYWEFLWRGIRRLSCGLVFLRNYLDSCTFVWGFQMWYHADNYNNIVNVYTYHCHYLCSKLRIFMLKPRGAPTSVLHAYFSRV